MIRWGNEVDSVEENRKRIWNSLCHASALNVLLLVGNKLEADEERRNLELGKYVIKVLKDPVLVSGFALSLVKGVAKLLTEFVEEKELREDGVRYVKFILKKIKNVRTQPSSPEEFENELGTWSLEVMNTIFATQVMPAKEYEKRLAERGLYLNFAKCSLLDFAHIGLALHRSSFDKLFRALPAEAFSPSFVRDVIKRLLTYEAQYHPELNEALKILD